MTTKSFFQTMSDGTEIAVNRWIPDNEPKAVIVISHGMSEHSLRYDRTASCFVEAGFLVSAHDHRGHGRTAQKQLEKGQPGFGYLADKDGYKKVREDLLEVINQLKKEFPGKKIILLAHSFGSLIGQSFIENHSSEIDLCILCGSRGPQQGIARLGLFVTNIMYIFGRKKKLSKFLDKMIFGSYSERIKDPRTANDWLTKDENIVDMYMSDSWCGFIMTTEFYHEMVKLCLDIHNPKNMKKIREDLHVYIIAGKEDPVGLYGKTLENLFSIYKKNGIKDVELKLYENDRHELLNETDYETVLKDLCNWINKRV